MQYFSEDFVREEHSYRAEKIRDQDFRLRNSVSRRVKALALAAVFLTAFGVAGTTGDVSPAPLRVIDDMSPTWEPNVSLLRDLLGPERITEPAPTEFGGMAAPAWAPNYGLLETILGPAPQTGHR